MQTVLRLTLVAASTALLAVNVGASETLPVSTRHPLVHAYRTEAEAAKYYVVRSVAARAPRLHIASALVVWKDRNHLIVSLKGHTATGIWYETELVRRNGIGFAVESSKGAFVRAAAPIGSTVTKAAASRNAIEAP